MRLFWISCLAVWFLVGVGRTVPAAQPQPGGWEGDAPLVDAKVRQAMQDRNYPEAVKAIDQATQAKDAPRDYLAYLKGWALCLAKQHEAAVATFEMLEKDFPQSRWARRARFARAIALARKGDFRAAETVYRAEAEFFLSTERRHSLAAIYLEFADGQFKPAKEDEKPDYQKALELYREALGVGLKPEKQAEVELLVARCCQELGNHDQAAKLYAKFSKDHSANPLDVEARYRLGECHLAKGNRREARRVWQDLLAKYPDSKSDRVPESAYHLARTWQIPKPETNEELNLGVAALEAFLQRCPAHKLAGQAHLDIARSYVHRGRHEDAVASLTRFLKDERCRDCKELPEASRLLGDSYRDQKKFAEALTAWREFLAKYPTHEAWSDVQKEIVTTEYLMGMEQHKAKQYDAAVKLLTEFTVKYPLDGRNPGILFLFGQIHADQKRHDEAIAAWRRLAAKYPGTEEASHAQLKIAETLERGLDRLEEALEEYRKVTGRWAPEAQQAILRLTGTSMAIAAERVFRSNETPRIQLVTRNLESVTIRAYRIDLETYFRKMHGIWDVEQLDIALIDPDRSFEFKVPGYAKHRQLESTVDLPLPGDVDCGAMVVTASSKTLEATTLVIQSDLDVILKSSREEVFVWAEDLRTGKPWPGVRLLVSDGQRVVREIATDAQGIGRATLDAREAAETIRVFAAAEGHTACSAGALRGGVGQGLTDRGYLYTDMPVYTPGATVHLRGCIRQVAAGQYVIEKDKTYGLAVCDGRGRMVHRQDVKLGPLGSFDAQFTLPTTSPQGAYRVLVQDEAGHSYSGEFQVLHLAEEFIRLEVDAPRRVYYRGEEIEGTIQASYYHGDPLVGREIRYQLADEGVQVAKTDAKGEVRFKLPTREFSETQTLPLSVTLPEQNQQRSVNFFLATQGFSLTVGTSRPVFIAGEPLEVTVTARDAEGKPVAEKLMLRVLERTTVEGNVGERLVEEQAVATGADGMLRQTLKLAKGGKYALRVEGTDRFKNPVSGQATVEISDADDKNRLRILADRHTYHVGDTAEVVVHWRDEPALALVTFESTRVIGHRLVDLQKGINKLSIPITAPLAPNFQMAVAIMTDGHVANPPHPGDHLTGEVKPRPVRRFHEAWTPFAVQRELNVTISCQPKAGATGAVRPGEPVEVTITTTDPQGKPVAAEVSLAMVHQSLVDRFRWPVGAIQDLFRGQVREPVIHTTSSITFEDRPATRPIHPRLLAERDREEIAQEEDASRHRGPVPCPGVPEMAAADPFAAPAGQQAMSEEEAAFRRLADRINGPRDEAQEAASDDPFGAPQANQAGVGGKKDDELRRKQLEQLASKDRSVKPAKPAAVPLPGAVAQVGYWNPAITTDQNGKATVSFPLPEQSTAWHLVAKGITADTLAGEATEKLVVRKDLFGEIKLPGAFTEGDVAEIPVTVHNHLVQQKPIEVILRTTIAGQSSQQQQTLDVKAKGIHQCSFKVPLARPAQDKKAPAEEQELTVQFELSVRDGRAADVVRRAVALRPYGVPVFATASGSATSDTIAWVEMPKDLPVTSRRLQIVLGPTIERSLLDILFAPEPACQAAAATTDSEVETATSDVMAALGLQHLLGLSRDADGPQADAIGQRLRAALALLILAQNEDGGWGWTACGPSDLFSTARVFWALSLARRFGHAVQDEPYLAALRFLEQAVAKVDSKDYESRTILLHALSVAGRADFAMANHLHRERWAMSPAAQLYLTLALISMDRKSMAGEVLDLVSWQNFGDPASSRQPAVELRALFALASETLAPKKPETKESIDWLLARRSGHRWTPDRATGLAAMALCHWFSTSKFEGQRYRLAILVNDQPVATLDVDPTAGSQVIDVPASLLVAGKQKVQFQLTGRGRYAYQCRLRGEVPAEQIKSTSDDWQVARTHEPAFLERDGRQVPRGFGVVQGKVTTFRNPLTQIPVAHRGQVHLVVRRSSAAADTPATRLEYLVITEPIPAGAAVIESTVEGGFDRFEIVPGAITFYVGSRKTIDPIRYQLHGYLPGTYRAAPTVVRNAHRPEQQAVGTPASLAVLPLGAECSDPYRLTPVELYELSKLLVAKGDWKTAAPHLAELVDKWHLQPDVYKHAVEMLLDAHLELGPPEKIVHYFEIVKERWPEKEIPFEKIVKVGAAYHDLGEFERSYYVFRATVEGSFDRETGLAGVLDAQGEFLRSVALMGRLASEYPPEGYVAEAEYALTQQVAIKAADAVGDPKLRRAKINRVDLLRRAWAMLESFLTANPEDPAADQAAFSAASVLLELKDFPATATACAGYAARYQKSELLDNYLYMLGYCRFAVGQHKEALEICRKVSEMQRIDKQTGRRVEALNKWQAIYILGQIHHSLGQYAEAIREYRRVEDRFADAKLSIAYFLSKAISLPEVTTLKPGEPVELELKFRNVGACDVKVYRIDLMKFGLLRGDLAGIAQINLAGIRPQHEATAPLGDGKDYRDRLHKLPLPLNKEGAYLVVGRGENLHASGLVLITQLAVEVQTDLAAGQVRAMVKDVVADRYLSGVELKVTGGRTGQFVSGTTDLRGVFVAEGIDGAPTVIAQAEGGRYAFFRNVPRGLERDWSEANLARQQRIERGRPRPIDEARQFLQRSARPQPQQTAAEADGTTWDDVPVSDLSRGLGSGESPGVRKILKALESPTELEFIETPLQDVLDFIRDYHQIEVQLDQKALDDVGIGSDSPITRSLKGISLRSALRLLLRELDLTYTIEDEVLLVTTPEEAETRLNTVIYPVSDLVVTFRDPSTGETSADYDSLIDLITSTIQPTTWDEVGGPGSIGVYERGGALVLSQTQDVHQAIAAFLETLRRSGGSLPVNSQPAVRSRPSAPADSPAAFGGGMGGMGGAEARGVAASKPTAPPQRQPGDLLEGLHDANRQLQGQQVEKLKARYKGGMGGGFGGKGVGAGAAF